MESCVCPEQSCSTGGIPAACEFKPLSAEEAFESLVFWIALPDVFRGSGFVVSVSYEKYLTKRGFALKHLVTHLPVVF